MPGMQRSAAPRTSARTNLLDLLVVDRNQQLEESSVS
jgi:hypothetical protein